MASINTLANLSVSDIRYHIFTNARHLSTSLLCPGRNEQDFDILLESSPSGNTEVFIACVTCRGKYFVQGAHSASVKGALEALLRAVMEAMNKHADSDMFFFAAGDLRANPLDRSGGKWMKPVESKRGWGRLRKAQTEQQAEDQGA